MVSRQQGFTIIELVVVIVILGILAAVAFPKFQTMSQDARDAVIQGGAAALKSAAIITFAKNQGVKQSFTAIVSQIDADSALTFNPPCATATVTHSGGGTSAAINISEYCSG